MNWMDNLERKYGKYAIRNITRYMALISIIGSIFLSMIGEEIIYKCAFFMPYILRGQVWRLITWVFYPTSEFGFLGILFIICLVMLGNSLESYFGSFRMNMYFFTGILLNIIGGVIIYFVLNINVYLSLYHILFGLYLMLGIFMPDSVILVSFVFPVKMKWLLYFYAATMGYDVYTNFATGFESGVALSTELILSLVNLAIFVYFCKSSGRKQRKRRKEYSNQFSSPRPGSGITQHKCCICGRTEKDAPNLVFRYCSKCDGGREYCQEHLFTHEHFKINN